MNICNWERDVKMELNEYIAVYVPGRYKDGVLIPIFVREQIVRRITCLMVTDFGGTTNSEATVNWVNSRGEIVTEKVNIIKSFYIGKTDRMFAKVLPYALAMKVDLKQEAVSIEQNGRLYII